MNKICDKNLCTGCMACVNICSHNALSMESDIEGFLYPQVDQTKCVDCGLCVKTCPINIAPSTNSPIDVYSGWIKDVSLRMASSSGGAFTTLAMPVLNDGGVVFGVALDDNLKAYHTYVESVLDLSRLRGSKYVQSYIGDSYKDAKKFLQAGRKVLFSGTPCQIAGLKKYLRKEYDNLFTIDLICHGVPSPKIFEDWKSYMKKRFALKDITSIDFRGKKSSWIFFHMTIDGHVEKDEAFHYEGKYYDDPYIRGFLRDYFLRPSCHQCHFTKIERCSDFTIADWWGYQSEKGETRDFEKKGVSLMLCNTEKAVSFYNEKCSGYFVARKRTLEEACRTNASLQHPFPPSPLRDQFWDDYSKLPFNMMVEKYMYKERLPLSRRIFALSSNPTIRYVAKIVTKFENLINKTSGLFKL